MAVDENLKQYATERQWEIYLAVCEHGSNNKAALALGINRRAADKAMLSLKTKAAMAGYSPEHDLIHPIAPGYIGKGHSTAYNMKTGEPIIQWVKTRADEEAREQFRLDAMRAFFEELPPVEAPAAPTDYETDIVHWYQIGDAHIGMLAHEAEVGQNFDLKIAERELCAAIAALVDEAEPCERCVINDMGDFTHYENFSATTEASGHALDFDSRFPRMIRTYSRTMRRIIDSALSKYKYVDVIINQGNHSRTNDVWMAELLRVAYRNSGRVNVLNNDSVFIPYRMGNTFVMTHHSDKCKPSKLANVMATDFHQDWGESLFRYIDIGHIHHQMTVKEHPGVVIESWNQLAAPDKYAHDGGWRSRQSITRVNRSKTYGEKGRRVMSVFEVRDRIIAAMGSQGSEPPARRKVFTI